jgi:HNH endonuclease
VSSIPPSLRRRLRAEAVELRCAYCHSPERLLGLALEADHIIATARGGKTVLANLCLICRTCNGHKWQIVKARDPVTNRLVNLFHPRRQKWPEHFQWSDDGTRITGLTATGRATIETLQMNNDLIVNLRSLWVILDLHPAE